MKDFQLQRSKTKSGCWEVWSEGVKVGETVKDIAGWWYTGLPNDNKRYWSRADAAKEILRYLENKAKVSTGSAPTQKSEYDKVVEKIRKCLALSKSSNEHEASLAAAKAQDLMFKYNINVATVEASKSENVSRQGFKLSSRVNWKRLLLFAVSTPNFCRAFSHHGTQYMSIIGEPHNVEFVKWLYQFLENELIRIADEKWLTMSPDRRSWYSGRTWRDSFYRGAIDMVEARLWEQRRSSERESPDTKALVLLKDAKVLDAVKRIFPTTTPGDYGQAQYTRAYNEGIEAGKKLSLNKPISDEEVAPTRQLK